MPARQDSAGVPVLSVPLGGTRGSGGSGALWGWWFRAPTNPGFARHISPHSSEMLPAQPGEVQGEGWTVAGSIRRRRIERLPPVCPTCLWVSLSDTTAMLLAGWEEEESCPCLEKCSNCLGFPKLLPAWSYCSNLGVLGFFQQDLSCHPSPNSRTPAGLWGVSRVGPAGPAALTWAGFLHFVP